MSNELVKKAIKYIVEGIIVAFASYVMYLPDKVLALPSALELLEVLDLLKPIHILSDTL
jgi:hypothetical protein